MLDAMRWGSFCRRHWEKRQSWVCSSVMECVIEVMHFLTLSTCAVKISVAKVEDPTGLPRRRKPVVSSTGMAGADLSVGCGCVENSAMVIEIAVDRVGLIV